MEPENRQRVGILASMPALLQRLGVDAAEVLQAVGLPTDALDDPEATIPYAAMGRLVSVAAERTACPHLGLLIGAQIGFASYGLVGALMQNAPTLGAALQDFVRHHHRIVRGGVAYLLAQDGTMVFGYAIYQPRMAASPQVYDGAAAVAFNIVRGLAGAERAPKLDILLSRAEPADLAPYQRFFDSPMQFSTGQTGVSFARSWLDQPVAGACATRRAALEQRVAAYSLVGECDVLAQLRRALRVALFSGHPADSAVAAQLGLHKRTLSRRLAGLGVNFQIILDETRREMAQQLLAHTPLGIGAVGLILRYAEPSIFTRAFTRWTGSTPTDWRAQRDMAA